MYHQCYIDVEGSIEALHVKVMKVKRGSPAREAKVHCQMYLKSLAVANSNSACAKTFTAPLIIDTSLCRKGRNSVIDPLGDIWSVRKVDDSHCVDVDALVTSVDKILTQAYLNKKLVSVELVEYIT